MLDAFEGGGTAALRLTDVAARTGSRHPTRASSRTESTSALDEHTSDRWDHSSTPRPERGVDDKIISLAPAAHAPIRPPRETKT